LNPAEIITLINIASQLAEVINKSVVASNDEQVKDAWLDAQRMFNKGFLAAYENVLKNGEVKQTESEMPNDTHQTIA
jgi:hypothetical protein